MNFLLLLFACFLTGSKPTAEDKVIEPPEQAPFTIQVRIDRAVEGDTVLVPPGTYFENIDFLGKAIVLKSEAGPESTIIDGSSELNSVITFQGCTDTTSVLSGFTVTHGTGTFRDFERLGGGILALYSSCKLLDCIIEENLAGLTPSCGRGGGIYINNYSGAGRFVMKNCIMRNNQASTSAGGVFACSVSGYIANCKITKNMATGDYCFSTYGGGCAAGIYLACSDSFIVKNNLFSNNISARPSGEYSTPIGGGMVSSFGSHIIRENLFIGNASSRGGAIYIADNSEGTLITRNKFIENSAGDYWTSGRGGAVYCNGTDADALIINNIFLRNGAYPGLSGDPYGGSVEHQKHEGGVFNNIIAETRSGIAAALMRPPHGNNCYWDNADGDVDDPEEHAIFADPLLRQDEFRLEPASPCIDAGAVILGDTTFCGELPDIGAWENCLYFIEPFWASDSIHRYHHNRKE